MPVLHIVGVPSTKVQKAKRLLHHTLGDGQFDLFKKAAERFTAAQAFLQSAENAAEEIDRVLRVALEKARPTYLGLPTDLVFAPLSRSLLDTPIISSASIYGYKSTQLVNGAKLKNDLEADTLRFVIKEIQQLWDQASNPIILVDAGATRQGVSHLVRQLVDKTGVKVSSFFNLPLCLEETSLTRSLAFAVFHHPHGQGSTRGRLRKRLRWRIHWRNLSSRREGVCRGCRLDDSRWAHQV